MTHHQPDAGSGDHATLLARQVEPFARPEAEAIHGSVDVQRRRPDLGAALPEAGPFEQLFMRA